MPQLDDDRAPGGGASRCDDEPTGSRSTIATQQSSDARCSDGMRIVGFVNFAHLMSLGAVPVASSIGCDPPAGDGCFGSCWTGSSDACPLEPESAPADEGAPSSDITVV